MRSSPGARARPTGSTTTRCSLALEQSQAREAGWRGWWDWPEPLARRDPQALAAARVEQAAEVFFWCFVQWCFDTQWQAVRAHARRRGVALMGDLPIFIAHHSADCWARPDLYWLDEAMQPTVVAGVPPDFFSATGQRWGNPLYRWDRMADEGHAWWIARVRRALDLADVFRIDHFRGFAAYWEIAADCPTAIDGRWIEGPGRRLFVDIERALGALPIVAEDLGVITPDVEALRDGLSLPGMRILHFAFGDDADNDYLPHRHVANTVAYTGTHDNDTTRGWWRQRERGRAALCGGLPRAGHRAPAGRRCGRRLGRDPRDQRIRGQPRDVSDAGRARPRRDPPHEHPRHGGRQLDLALRLGDGGCATRTSPAPPDRGVRALSVRAPQRGLRRPRPLRP